MNPIEPEWRRHGRFLSALLNDDVATVRDLLNGRGGPPVDPDIRVRIGGVSKPALCVAVERDRTKIAQLLVMNGCSVNLCGQWGMPAVHTAVMQQNVKLLALLLASGANVRSRDHQGCTPLHLAARIHRNHSLEMAKLLVAAGSPVDQVDSLGLTPLSLACVKGHTALVFFLLSAGASTSLADISGDTALHHACISYRDDSQIVQMLVDAKAPVNQKNKEGLTPLAYAIVCRADSSITRILLRHGGDAQLTFGSLQQTLLHFATYNNDDEDAKLLVQSGVSPFTVDLTGCSSIDVALTLDWSLALWFLRACPEMGHGRRRVAEAAASATSTDTSCSGRAAFLAEALSVPKLTQLSRYAFRKKYARHADAVIRSLLLPPNIVRFLLLNDDS